MPKYTVHGWLPGGVPLAATNAWAWLGKHACYDDNLYIGNARTLEGARAEFAESTKACYDRMRTYVACDPDQSGIFLARTRGEVNYQTHLDALTPQAKEAWRGQDIVSNDDWV